MIAAPLRRATRPCHSYHSISPRPAPSLVTVPFSTRSHQRRHSSSKPPVPPNDGSANLTAPTVKTVGAAQSKEAGDKRPGAESRLSKRKVSRDRNGRAVDTKAEWATNLPSVPSTQHVDPRDILLASFFSLHRPISVTSPIPPSSSLETIDSIFVPRTPASKTKLDNAGEVIYTLASAVQHLDGNIANHQEHHQNASKTQQQQDRHDVVSALIRHHSQESPSQPSDGNPTRSNAAIRVPHGVKLAIQELAARFRPFNVPPVPVPMPENESEAQEDDAAAAEQAEEMQARELEAQIENQDPGLESNQHQGDAYNVPEISDMRYRKFFTYNEATKLDHDGVAPPLPDVHSPSRRIGRIRRGGYKKIPGRGLARPDYKIFALSVKRQRKLKMKKHKYKKLMRKTRNLRRRLDRL